eukprot:TRINITY_DN10014_c3_g1_i2.p2 TRINITY_DN10014_c3_g1~~TRINITY_DN10014_c3_g1_i2.p2  ORF type:complete len:102 (-),score=0.93 TRINITY_DN10014_c3_g1_i2:191-496(-)
MVNKLQLTFIQNIFFQFKPNQKYSHIHYNHFPTLLKNLPSNMYQKTKKIQPQIFFMRNLFVPLKNKHYRKKPLTHGKIQPKTNIPQIKCANKKVHLRMLQN